MSGSPASAARFVSDRMAPYFENSDNIGWGACSRARGDGLPWPWRAALHYFRWKTASNVTFPSRSPPGRSPCRPMATAGPPQRTRESRARVIRGASRPLPSPARLSISPTAGRNSLPSPAIRLWRFPWARRPKCAPAAYGRIGCSVHPERRCPGWSWARASRSPSIEAGDGKPYPRPPAVRSPMSRPPPITSGWLPATGSTFRRTALPCPRHSFHRPRRR